MTAPIPAASQAAAAPRDNTTQDALARHRDALRQRFPLPPEALGPAPAPPPRRKHLKISGLAAAGMLAVAVLIGVDPAWRTEHVATGPQQRQSIELSDGTRVTLDTATRLSVSRHLRSRRVALERGSALFEVAPSAWRPFVVQAGSTQVRVVGTVFDVRRRGPQHENVTVTVLEGRVEVRGRPGQMALLGPGEQLHAAAGELAPSERTDTARARAWREGRLVFERTPLPEVLAEIAHYGGLELRGAEHPALAGLAVSGVYRTENAGRLLALLPSFLPIRVEPEGEGFRVTPLNP